MGHCNYVFCIPSSPHPHPSFLPLCSRLPGDLPLVPWPALHLPTRFTPWFLTHHHPLQASYRCMLSYSEARMLGFPAPGPLGMVEFGSPAAAMVRVSLCVQLSWSVVEWVLVCPSEAVGLAMRPERGQQDPNPQEPDRWARC